MYIYKPVFSGYIIPKREKYIIVGGAGHTTESLRKKVHMEFPQIETDSLTEAEIFQAYLQTVHGLKADFLECNSTNCGNNITYLLDLIRENKLPFHSIILAQDVTMQCNTNGYDCKRQNLA